MLKVSLCKATLILDVKAKSPILVGIGASEKRRGEDMQYFHWITTKLRGSELIYIPASSFKGVLRSHAERILRSYSPDFACNPLAQEAAEARGMRLSCSKRVEKLKEANEEEGVLSAKVYQQICPACRLFGCAGFAGHVLLDDIFPSTRNQPLREAHIAVDRFTQGVALGLGPFGRQPLDDLKFKTPITVVNFELWQLGLLALVVRDMSEGLVTIGSGSRHGHGEVEAKIEQVHLQYVKNCGSKLRGSAGKWTLLGISSLLPDAQARAYGYTEESSYEVPPHIEGREQRGWILFTLRDEDCHAFLRHCVRECLSPRLKGEKQFTLEEGESHA
jgi:CRISPR/Cas system CSM-associated protein Csm3 (group 7 of RAMP superfamily)